jgi:AcrR family transcriptional regulator
VRLRYRPDKVAAVEGRGIDRVNVLDERRRPNSRAALIQAALEEFSTKGYEEATVAGIAERAGVTTGALYAHFAGKLDLLLATVGLASIDDILRSAGELASLPWSEASKAITQSLSSRPDRRMLLLLDVIVVARRDPHVARTLRRGIKSYLEAMTTANDDAVALGVIDPALSTEDLARVMALLTMGKLVFGALDETPPSDPGFAQLADLLLQSAGTGAAAGAGGSGPGSGDDDGNDADQPADQPAALARVRGRAATAERARRSLHEGIVEAVHAGHSLRQVGTAAGVSHERIRQVLRDHDAASGALAAT